MTGRRGQLSTRRPIRSIEHARAVCLFEHAFRARVALRITRSEVHCDLAREIGEVELGQPMMAALAGEGGPFVSFGQPDKLEGAMQDPASR